MDSLSSSSAALDEQKESRSVLSQCYWRTVVSDIFFAYQNINMKQKNECFLLWFIAEQHVSVLHSSQREDYTAKSSESLHICQKLLLFLKSPRLNSPDRNLFPCGDSMVCIIDDREDVWKFAPNLITVKKYIYFQGTGDINAPPGSREAQMAKKGTVFTRAECNGQNFMSQY